MHVQFIVQNNLYPYLYLVEYRTWCEDWVFPGGEVDKGEEPLAAALREANEELGIEALQPVEGLDIAETRTHSGRLIVPFLIRRWLGEIPQFDNDNHAPLAWQRAEALLTHKLESQRFIAAALLARGYANSALPVLP